MSAEPTTDAANVPTTDFGASPYAFVYDPGLGEYQLSDSHPFKPLRLELTRSLLECVGLLDKTHFVTPEPISEALLRRVHTDDYVAVVKTLSAGRSHDLAFQSGLGTADNPIFPGMHDAIMAVCSATVKAVDLVASGRAQRALNLSGGLHHAFADRASGFCVYNDLALGIEHAAQHYGLRVLYLDIDAHHGDGVQQLFYERGDVMTVSIHESGRYLFPGTGHTYELGKNDGRGLSVNVPLEPFTEDDSYLECFEAVVPAAIEAFRPDLILLQAGADMHRYDPLADLALSTRSIGESYRRVSELADEFCDGRLVATGGGGYDAYRTAPRAWSQLWAALSRQDMPATLPESWRQRWQPRSDQPLPSRLYDDLADWDAIPRQSDIEAHNRTVLRRLRNTLDPVWRERFGYTLG